MLLVSAAAGMAIASNAGIINVNKININSVPNSYTITSAAWLANNSAVCR